jgi:hypothetical protein
LDLHISIPDKDLDFLGAGETLTATYDVTVADGAASSTQTVTVTATEAEDPLVVNPATGVAADTPLPRSRTSAIFFRPPNRRNRAACHQAGCRSASVFPEIVNGGSADQTAESSDTVTEWLSLRSTSVKASVPVGTGLKLRPRNRVSRRAPTISN